MDTDRKYEIMKNKNRQRLVDSELCVTIGHKSQICIL